jgi:maltose phosphorylase
MKEYLKHHEWQIIEEDFHPENQLVSESVFSIGNGKMGQRANFEEEYSGESLLGSYVAGIYYPDKTRVGWWKNGYPEYFAKVLNSPSWIGVKIKVSGVSLDLMKCKPRGFRRVLDMKRGLLSRVFTAQFPDGKEIEVKAERFCSMANGELGAIRYSITPLNFSESLNVTLGVDADIHNEDSNYDEKFWDEVDRRIGNESGAVTTESRNTLFRVCTGYGFVV